MVRYINTGVNSELKIEKIIFSPDGNNMLTVTSDGKITVDMKIDNKKKRDKLTFYSKGEPVR